MNRAKVELRILEILRLINHPIIEPLKESISIFSLKELLQILKFLETWDLNPINQFLEEKTKEYIWIIEEIKMMTAFSKLQSHKNIEEKEREKENKEIENMIIFD